MSEPKTKATPAPPYDGKPTWHGRYWQGGQWCTVCNRNGDPIAYATPGAAIAAAWLEAA